MKEEILYILNRYESGSDDGYGGLNVGVFDYSYEDVAKEITSHVMKFMEWYMTGNHAWGRVEYETPICFVYFPEGSKNKYTLEDVYKFWLDTIKE